MPSLQIMCARMVPPKPYLVKQTTQRNMAARAVDIEHLLGAPGSRVDLSTTRLLASWEKG